MSKENKPKPLTCLLWHWTLFISPRPNGKRQALHNMLAVWTSVDSMSWKTQPGATMPSCFFTSYHCAASLFRLASMFLSSLTFCLQGTLSLVLLASTIDEPLSQCWMWCFCVDLIFGETGSSLLLTEFAELSAKKCICCWPCHFALLKQHSFCFWALLSWFTRCSLRRTVYFMLCHFYAF